MRLLLSAATVWLLLLAVSINLSCSQECSDGLQFTRAQDEDQITLTRCGNNGFSPSYTYPNGTTVSSPFTVTQDNEGIYRCTASIFGGSVEDCAVIMPVPQQPYADYNMSYDWGSSPTLNCFFPSGAYPQGYRKDWRAHIFFDESVIAPVQNNSPSYMLDSSSENLTITGFHPLLVGSYWCQTRLRSSNNNNAFRLSSRIGLTILPKEGGVDNITAGPQRKLLVSGSQHSADFSCTASVTGGDQYIAFRLFDDSLSVNTSECPQVVGHTRLRCSNKALGNATVTALCDYSTPYQISCNFSVSNLPVHRMWSNVACSIMNGTNNELLNSSSTGLVIRDTNQLGAPVIDDSMADDLIVTINLPFINSPPIHSLSMIVNNDADTNTTVPIIVNGANAIDIWPNDTSLTFKMNKTFIGTLKFAYVISFFGEEGEMSNLSPPIVILPTSSVTVYTSTTSEVSPEPTTISTMASSPSSSTPKIIPDPSVAAADVHVLTYIVPGAIGVVLTIIIVLVIILFLLIAYGRMSRHKKGKVQISNHTTQQRMENGNIYPMNDFEESPMYGVRPRPPEVDQRSWDNSAMSLINSEHSPSHINGSHTCNCSCHTRSTRSSHSSAPSHSSAASYNSRSRLAQDLPRYGHPAAEYNPPMLSTQYYQQHYAPNTLSLHRDVPEVCVQLPTPVMIDEKVTLSPTDTEPFESVPNSPVEAEEEVDTSRAERPTHLPLPSKKSSQRDSLATTPSNESTMLAILLYLQHEKCENPKTCVSCQLIKEQFSKIARKQGQGYLEKAVKDIQTPGTEAHKILKRRDRGRTPRSPYRPNLLHVGLELKRQRSSSTSKVYENELTFSSTETEEEDRKVKSFRPSRKARTDDELDKDELSKERFFIPLSSVPTDIQRSEPELTPTPIALPPSFYQGVTPTNPAPSATPAAPKKEDSFTSNDSISSTDSNTSSFTNSNSHLDNLNPEDSIYFQPPPSLNKYDSYSSGYMSLQENEKERSRSQAPPPSSALKPLPSSDSESTENLLQSTTSSLTVPSRCSSAKHGSQSNSKHHHQQHQKHSSPVHLQKSASLSPSNVVKNGRTAHHGSPQHSQRPSDVSSIRSMQSARIDYSYSSDQSSGGSNQSIHSEGALLPSYQKNGHHHCRHHSGTRPAGFTLPKKESTATKL